MWLPARSWMVLSLLAARLLAGCADVPPSAESPVVTVACRDTFQEYFVFPWELEVTPDREIIGGQAFDATLDGIAVFPESYLVRGLFYFTRGIAKVESLEFNATVGVRRGASGPPKLLVPEPIDDTCFEGGNECDPQRDSPDGNPDCKPQGPANPCGRFVELPASDDCSSNGVCARRGAMAQCDQVGFCITGDLRVPLQQETGHYTAAAEGEVLFGWDETGASLQKDGTWSIPEVVYDEPAGPLGVRITVPGEEGEPVPGAWDCVMGVCANHPLGVGCSQSPTKQAPDEALVSFPIQTVVP